MRFRGGVEVGTVLELGQAKWDLVAESAVEILQVTPCDDEVTEAGDNFTAVFIGWTF